MVKAVWYGVRPRMLLNKSARFSLHCNTYSQAIPARNCLAAFGPSRYHLTCFCNVLLVLFLTFCIYRFIKHTLWGVSLPGRFRGNIILGNNQKSKYSIICVLICLASIQIDISTTVLVTFLEEISQEKRLPIF